MKVFVVFLALLIGFSVEAQIEPFLLLQKPGNSKKRIKYFQGDKIIFKLYDSDEYYHGVITRFSDTSFVLNGVADIPTKKVKVILDKSRASSMRALAISAFSTIPVFMVYSAANNIFNTGNRPVIDEYIYPLSGVFAGIGSLAFLLRNKKHRLQNRWHLSVVRM